MPGLEDKQVPIIPKVNDSLGGDTGLDGIPIPASGQIQQPTFTELADGADAVNPQPGKQGLDTFAIPSNGTPDKTKFSGDGLAS
tara:strand:- start:284 stop:535 length:252 start_codon:yes stop_codon:yes gene_type:complete